MTLEQMEIELLQIKKRLSDLTNKPSREELKEGAVFTGQIYKVETKRAGGGRIEIDFGREAMKDIHWVEKIAHMKGDCNFQIAIVPLPDPNLLTTHDEVIYED